MVLETADPLVAVHAAPGVVARHKRFQDFAFGRGPFPPTSRGASFTRAWTGECF